MQTVADSEYGSVYVDSNGEFVFQDRAVTAGSIGGTVTTVFNDDGTGIAYANANWKLDDTLIFNSATVTRIRWHHKLPLTSHLLTNTLSIVINARPANADRCRGPGLCPGLYSQPC
jgi:hypothetical protein